MEQKERRSDLTHQTEQQNYCNNPRINVGNAALQQERRKSDAASSKLLQACCNRPYLFDTLQSRQIKDCPDVIYYFYILEGNVSCDL